MNLTVNNIMVIQLCRSAYFEFS